MEESVKIGVIGAGYWGPNLIRNFSEIDQSRVVSVCDVSDPRLEYITGKFPDLRTTNDYQDILKDNSIDAVVIATPLETHFEIAKAVLEAGKHVFIEKPMTCNPNQAMELVDMALARSLKIGTGHIFVYHPAVVKMKEMLSRQRLSTLFYAYSTRMNPAPSHGNVDVIWDLAVHDISIVLYLIDSEPSRVRASGGAFAHSDRVDVATIELYFPDGILTYHHVGWLTSAKERSFFLAGEGGSIKFDDTKDRKLEFVGPAVDTRLDSSAQAGDIFYAPGKTEVVQLPDYEPLKSECENFIQAVLNRKVMTSDGLFGHAVVRILEAASHSISNDRETVVLEKLKYDVF